MKATFLLSGWAAAEEGGEARHVVRLVEGQQVRLDWLGHIAALCCMCCSGCMPAWVAEGRQLQLSAQ